MTRPRVPLEERLWKNVDIGDEDECWPWLRSQDDYGYGRIAVGAGSTALLRTHRAAWIVTFGEIPIDMKVGHECNNPPCCNPAHLFLGTTADINREMIRKGRDGGAAAENRRKTHCKRGHPLSDSNLVIDSKGKRQCRECSAERYEVWLEVTAERRSENGKRWYEANKEHRAEYSKLWAAQNRELKLSYSSNWRARRRDQFVEHVDRQIVWERDEGVCGICGLPAKKKRWDLDHIIPLIRGGMHCYDNVQVSHPSCNNRKAAKLMEELQTTQHEE